MALPYRELQRGVALLKTGHFSAICSIDILSLLSFVQYLLSVKSNSFYFLKAFVLHQIIPWLSHSSNRSLFARLPTSVPQVLRRIGGRITHLIRRCLQPLSKMQ